MDARTRSLDSVRDRRPERNRVEGRRGTPMRRTRQVQRRRLRPRHRAKLGCGGRPVNQALRVALVLGAASCVPAGEEGAPKGALGASTEPSPAARGEAFVTDDGWTVHVETLALRVRITATPRRSDDGQYQFGGDQEYMFHGAARAELFVPALKPG